MTVLANFGSTCRRYDSAFSKPSVCAAKMRPRSTTRCATPLPTPRRGIWRPREAADAVWTLARENQWHREGERAERDFSCTDLPGCHFATKLHSTSSSRGTASRSGIFDMTDSNGDGIRLNEKVLNWSGGRPPANCRPSSSRFCRKAGWNRSSRTRMNARLCVPASATCRTSPSSSVKVNSPTLPRDVLLTPWSRYSKDGVFTGTYAGPGRGEINEGFERNLARLFESSDTPRLSGIQIKAPMNLDKKVPVAEHLHAVHAHPQAGRWRWLRGAAAHRMAGASYWLGCRS